MPKPKSRQELIGHIFGESIPCFDSESNAPPTELDVIKRWMFEYDLKRGSAHKMPDCAKLNVIRTISNELVAIWEKTTTNLKSDNEIQIKIQKLVHKKAEPLGNFKRSHRKSNDQWREEKCKSFNRVFNISRIETTPNPMLLGKSFDEGSSDKVFKDRFR